MNCTTCGKMLNESAAFCPGCGQPVATQNTSTHSQQTGGNIGYSTRIADPAFASYAKQNNSWSLIFALIIAAIAIVGFYIYGEKGSEMDNPQALYIGLGIGGMFILIALFQIIGRKRDRDWDGIVIDKLVEQKREKKYHGNDRDSGWYWQEYTEYSVVIRTQEGKLHRVSDRDNTVKFDYYKIGDHVRHHGLLHSLEKYDKSQDTIVFCNACGYLNDITDDKCVKCGCPLLK